MERESTIVGVEEGDWIWRSEARVFNENAKLGFKQVKRGGIYIENGDWREFGLFSGFGVVGLLSIWAGPNCYTCVVT